MRQAAPLPETLVTCLTPAGAGAIATLALWGPRAWEAIQQLFQPFAAARLSCRMQWRARRNGRHDRRGSLLLRAAERHAPPIAG